MNKTVGSSYKTPDKEAREAIAPVADTTFNLGGRQNIPYEATEIARGKISQT